MVNPPLLHVGPAGCGSTILHMVGPAGVSHVGIISGRLSAVYPARGLFVILGPALPLPRWVEEGESYGRWASRAVCRRGAVVERLDAEGAARVRFPVGESCYMNRRIWNVFSACSCCLTLAVMWQCSFFPLLFFSFTAGVGCSPHQKTEM